MGDASRAILETGEVSFRRSKDASGVDLKRLPDDHPELAQGWAMWASVAGSRTYPLIPIGLCCFAAGKISEHHQRQVRSRRAAWLLHTCRVHASAGRGRR